jgi:DNA sulfur modification protein DndE
MIMAQQKDAGKLVNGWTFSLKTGLYGSDYLQRAFITAIGLGANRPQDAVYPTTAVDGDGTPLSGANHYVMHFPKGQTPPVNGFWSLTMYNPEYFFVDNPLSRYTLSPRNELKYNPDGSLDLYIQHDPPDADKETNWLPAPADRFVLMLRCYWPKESLLKGEWEPPAVQMIKENVENAKPGTPGKQAAENPFAQEKPAVNTITD